MNIDTYYKSFPIDKGSATNGIINLINGTHNINDQLIIVRSFLASQRFADANGELENARIAIKELKEKGGDCKLTVSVVKHTSSASLRLEIHVKDEIAINQEQSCGSVVTAVKTN